MENLFSKWPSVKKRLEGAKRILILLDYDGTLSPIASRPQEAVLDKGLKKTLVTLSKKKNVSVGIVSGRKLSQIRKIVGIRGIYYVGNHGLEIKGGNISFVHKAAGRFSPFIKRVKARLDQALRSIEDIIVEAKGLTLTVHWRLVKKKDLKRLKGIFYRVCAPYVREKKIRLSEGKKCWELVPPIKWDKGEAVKKILADFRKREPLTIYMGDDTTDEDAFRVLKRKGLTVFIGDSRTKTNAEYGLESVSEVKCFLRRLV